MPIVTSFSLLKKPNQQRQNKTKQKKVTNNANEFNYSRFVKRWMLQRWSHSSNIILYISWPINNSAWAWSRDWALHRGPNRPRCHRMLIGCIRLTTEYICLRTRRGELMTSLSLFRQGRWLLIRLLTPSSATKPGLDSDKSPLFSSGDGDFNDI